MSGGAGIWLPTGFSIHNLILALDFRNGVTIGRRGMVLTPTDITYATNRHDSDGATFNGTTSLINFGSDPIGTSAFTVMAWINASGFGEGNAGRIIDNGMFRLCLISLNSRFQASSDGLTTVHSANNSFTADTELHIAFTRPSAGANCNFYVNGALNGTANQNSGTPAAGITNLFIGNRSNASATFAGTMRQLLIFNKVLTASEIATFYNKYV